MSLYVPPRPAPAPLAKAGPVGPGAGPLMTEFLLPNVLPVDARRKMGQAVTIGREVAYVRLAEQVISTKIADPLMGVAWHIEDPQGTTVDDAYSDPRAREAYALVARPMAALRQEARPVLSLNAILEITSRHMGLAGQGCWYLDALNDFGIPAAWCYVRPDRLEPDLSDKGVLTQWILDRRPGNEGERLATDEIVTVQLQTPDEGIWAPGLVESALAKAMLNGAIDRHFAQVLAGGGRLSGIVAPKAGTIPQDQQGDAVYNQIVRDWRNVTEQPESARRLQVVRAPIDFTKTVLSPDEMKLIDLMEKNRDDLLAVWRVPLSQIGGSSPAGLNSGDIRKYDEAALWQNAVTPRLSRISTAIQTYLLDPFEGYLGWVPKIVFDIPEFDDDSPRFDKIQKSQFAPLTNDERRALLGLPPLKEVAPQYATQGDQIIMSNTQVPYDDLGVQPANPLVGQPTKPPEPPKPPAKAKDLASLDKGKQKGPDVTSAVLAALRKQWPAKELAIVGQGQWKYDPAYPLSKIDYARRPVARNPKIVSGVESALSVGAPIDPVVLVKTKRLGGSGGKPTEPIDGWHRLLAASHSKLDTVPAYIGTGDDSWTRALIAFDDDIPTPPDDYTGKAKASVRDGIVTFRSSLDARTTPVLRSAVGRVLDEQKRDIAARVRGRWEQIRGKPNDHSLWWRAGNGQRDPWNDALTGALAPVLTNVAREVDAHVRTLVPQGKATAVDDAISRLLAFGLLRVQGINDTTRTGLAALLAQAIQNGLSASEAGDLVEQWSGFDEYRGELIARTELMAAYNNAALASYADMGITRVEALDGVGDPECASRNGQQFAISEAQAIEDHPNGTLDWIPLTESIQ